MPKPIPFAIFSGQQKISTTLDSPKQEEPIVIDQLTDFSGTLSELQKAVYFLMEEYGMDATIETDAGYNNVTFKLTPKKASPLRHA